MACISALSASGAQAETLFLSCRMTAEPDFPLSTIYQTVPADDNQYFEDLTENGISLFIIQPPTTWAVDLTASTVTSPDSIQDYEITESSASYIRGDAIIPDEFLDDPAAKEIGLTWRLNRINGELEVRTMLTSHFVEKWRAKHGKGITPLWQWKQTCRASRPKM